jgi:hypothetical protein
LPEGEGDEDQEDRCQSSLTVTHFLPQTQVAFPLVLITMPRTLDSGLDRSDSKLLVMAA